jgi:heptaprenyl diphosphate synthase
MREFDENSKIYKVALLVSMSCVMQISESLIPHPIPGLRLGLANMLTLVALITLGFKYALQIAIYRTILSSFIIGTFMSPTFILSFSGAVISSVVMGFLYWLSSSHRHYRFSIIGISIFGALSHNMVQLYLAYLILVKHKGVFVFLPWLSIGAVVMGWITGAVASSVCRRLAEFGKQEKISDVTERGSSVPVSYHYVPGDFMLHRLSAETKISAIIVLSLVLLIFSNFWILVSLSCFLSVVVVSSNSPFAFLISRAKKYATLILMAFSLPLFFNSGTHILLHTPYLNITQEGLSTGALLAFRIVFLIFISSLLVRTTSPEELTGGLAKIFSFLRYLGISGEKVAMVLSLSWMGIPFFWETARRTIRSANVKKTKKLSHLIPALSHLIATLYLQAAPESTYWQCAFPKQENDSYKSNCKRQGLA